MTWNLFIDDERELKDVTWAPWQICEKYRNEDWVIVRSYGNAMVEIFNRGFPKFISFDHDLGENKKTGYDIAKYLVECAINGWKDSRGNTLDFTEDFDFYVHSQNPVGKTNIESYLNSYMKHKG